MVDKISNIGSILQLPKLSAEEIKHSATDVKIKRISKNCFEGFNEFLKKLAHFFRDAIKWIGKVLCCRKPKFEDEDFSDWDDTFSDWNSLDTDASLERDMLNAKSNELAKKISELDEAIAIAASLDDESKAQGLNLEKEQLVSLEKVLRLKLGALKIKSSSKIGPLDAKKLQWIEKKDQMKRRAFPETIKLAEKINRSMFVGVDKPRGLINIGSSSCYMNSALQTLEVLFQYNLSFKILLNLDLSLKEDETLIQLEERVLSLWKPLTQLPEESRSQFCKRILLKWNFLLLMQAMHYIGGEVLEEAVKLHHDLCFALELHHDFSDGEFEQKDVATYMEMLLQTLQEKPLTFKSFDRALKYRLVNKSQDDEIITNEPSIESLQMLQVPMSKPLDAQRLIEKFFGGEILDHDSPRDYYKKDKIVATAEKSVRFCKLVGESPETLKIHFKRFSWFENNSHKLNADIKPFEDGVVDLRDYYQEGEPGKRDAIYFLVGIVVHRGTLDSGHYKAFVKKKIQRNGKLHRQWYCCNDGSVTEVPRRKVPKGQSYIGVFRRL